MSSIKSKFNLDQQVSVIKSGKSGQVKAIVVDATGVHLDVQMPAARRPWRYNEADLQTVAQAEKAAKAKAKAAGKPAVAKVVTAIAAPAKAAKLAKSVKPAKAKPVKAKKAAK